MYGGVDEYLGLLSLCSCLLLLMLVFRLIKSSLYDTLTTGGEASFVHKVKPGEVPVQKLHLPFVCSMTITGSRQTLLVNSDLPQWSLIQLENVDCQLIADLLLKPGEFSSVISWLELFPSKTLNVNSHEIDLTDMEVHSLDDEAQVRKCPLVLVATDQCEHMLICLVRTKVPPFSIPYIIAQFYKSVHITQPYRLMSLYSDQEESRECAICLCEPANCALLPCRHKYVCSTCVTAFDNCPICRHTIVSYFRTAD